jgi:hypothetical protein
LICFAFHFFSARGAAASRALAKRTVVNFADRPIPVLSVADENLSQPGIDAKLTGSSDGRDGVDFGSSNRKYMCTP